MEQESKKHGCFSQGMMLFLATAMAMVVLFLAVMAGASFVVEVPLYIAFGWIFFLKDNLMRMHFGWEMIGSSLIGWVFCLWLTHAFCQRVVRQKKLAPWRFLQTLRLNLLVFLFFAASCALVGCIHQSIWLFNNPVVVDRSKNRDNIRAISEMKQIYLLLMEYESEHGVFPDSLQALQSEGLAGRGEVLYARMGQMREPYLYFGKGLSTSQRGDHVILASPFLYNDRIGYLRIDGSARDEKFSGGRRGEDQFQQMIREGVWPKDSAQQPQ